MELTEQQKQILQGKICPYCWQESKLINSEEFYGVYYGMMYICKPCDAYVGCHKYTEVALGRLANKNLREFKKKAHECFDQIWQQKIMKRKEAYMWLSEQTGVPAEYMHIGMLGEQMCKIVITLCKKVLESEILTQKPNK